MGAKSLDLARPSFYDHFSDRKLAPAETNRFNSQTFSRQVGSSWQPRDGLRRLNSHKECRHTVHLGAECIRENRVARAAGPPSCAVGAWQAVAGGAGASL